LALFGYIIIIIVYYTVFDGVYKCKFLFYLEA